VPLFIIIVIFVIIANRFITLVEIK